jgi:glycosyltransferase involved in cell wall biosynthesis
VAIVHYWLVGMRGGERVLEELLRIYPQADIFTHVADPARLSPMIRERKITETFVARLPRARRFYQHYLGFMPRALEELDLRGYDLIISSESGPAKGIIPPPSARHICYVHSPMRYIWDHYHPYAEGLGRLPRLYFSGLAHRLRQWDVTTAARVDRFVANSSFVAQRVERYYRRNADVVHPPVDLETYAAPSEQTAKEYYLFVSQLVPYKRADIVIEAFRDFDRPLKVVGEGGERAALERDLPTNVELLGRVEQGELPALYQGAKALIFPAEEDFGIVPLEAMACGTPVLAFGRGGVRDSVIEGETGLFFDRQDPRAIRDAVLRFEALLGEHRFVPACLNEHARRFGAERFRAEFAAIADAVLDTA